jgi:hypothetical protein
MIRSRRIDVTVQSYGLLLICVDPVTENMTRSRTRCNGCGLFDRSPGHVELASLWAATQCVTLIGRLVNLMTSGECRAVCSQGKFWSAILVDASFVPATPMKAGTKMVKVVTSDIGFRVFVKHSST